MCLAIDFHENFVQIPVRLVHSEAPLADPRCENRSKLIQPEPNRLMTNFDPGLMQNLFEIAKRKRKTNLHHHRKTDDLRAGSEVVERVASCHARWV
jgi:hypothetical protein